MGTRRVAAWGVVVGLMIAVAPGWGLAQGPAAEPGKPLDLAGVQAAVTALADRAVRATVGLRSKAAPGSGSGVIVTADGLILTAGHCVRAAGGEMEAVLADGRVVRAKALGADWDADLGMAQLLEPGPWPFAEVSPAARPSVGDWCVAAGHPGGAEPDRRPVLRLGRVLDRGREVPTFKGVQLATDCRVMPGDSGGPLFDLTGRVVGVHCFASLQRGGSAAGGGGGHATAQSFRDRWEFLLSGQTAGTSKAIALDIAPATPGVPGVADPAAPVTTLDDLKRKWKLKDEAVAQLEQLRKVVPAEAFADALRQFDARLASGKADAGPITLKVKGAGGQAGAAAPPPELAADFKRSLAPLTEAARLGTVEVMCDGKRVALGTVVADGLVVTKASELAGKVVCRFAGRDSDAAVVQTNDANDLALISAPLVGATPVPWAAGEPDLARLLVAPRGAGRDAAFGVVGHAARRVPTLDAAAREGLLSPLEQAEARRRVEKLAALNPVFGPTPAAGGTGSPAPFRTTCRWPPTSPAARCSTCPAGPWG